MSVLFAASDFASAFQLACAFNLGLVAFKQLRAPVQSRIDRVAHDVAGISSQTVKDATAYLRSLEANAQRLADAKGDIEFSQYLDHDKHEIATNIMTEAVDVEVEIESDLEDFGRLSRNWEDHDNNIMWSALCIFLISFFGLATVTFVPNFIIQDNMIIVYKMAFGAWLLLCYLPLLYSLILTFQAQLRLRALERHVVCTGRRCFSVRLRLNREVLAR